MCGRCQPTDDEFEANDKLHRRKKLDKLIEAFITYFEDVDVESGLLKH